MSCRNAALISKRSSTAMPQDEQSGRQARRENSYCAGSRIWLKPMVLIARSMGVKGGSKFGVRKFMSKAKARVRRTIDGGAALACADALMAVGAISFQFGLFV